MRLYPDVMTNPRLQAFKFGYAYRGLLSDPCCGDAGSGECSNATHCATTTATRDEMVGKALAERTMTSNHSDESCPPFFACSPPTPSPPCRVAWSP